MNRRKVNIANGNVNSDSDDPYDVLGTFLGFSAVDLVRSQDPRNFIRQFDPSGEGYYVYDVAAAFRSYLPPQPDDHEPQAVDDWTVQYESCRPTRTVYLSGDELRDLFHQIVVALVPEHPRLQAVLDDLHSPAKKESATSPETI